MKKHLFIVALFLCIPLTNAQMAAVAHNETADGYPGIHRATGIHCCLKFFSELFKNSFIFEKRDFCDLRHKLEDKGIAFSVVYTGDSVSNASGGLKRGASYIGNLDLQMTVDTAKAGLWNKGAFFVYGIYNLAHNYRRASISAMPRELTILKLRAFLNFLNYGMTTGSLMTHYLRAWDYTILIPNSASLHTGHYSLIVLSV